MADLSLALVGSAGRHVAHQCCSLLRMTLSYKVLTFVRNLDNLDNLDARSLYKDDLTRTKLFVNQNGYVPLANLGNLDQNFLV